MARWHAVNWTRYHSLLHAAAKLGCEIYVLQPPPMKSSETNFCEIDPVDIPNIHVREVPVSRGLWNANFPLNKLVKKALFSNACLGMAKRMVAEEEIDAVLLYNIPQICLSRIRGCVQIFDFADDYVGMLSKELGRVDNRLARSLASHLVDSMIQRADLAFAVSHELAREGGAKVMVLPNGVNGEAFEGQVSFPDVIVFNGDKPVVGFLGAFEYFIDFDVILHAARQLPNVHFLLVGTGRDWDKVRDIAVADDLRNVQLTGGVPHTHVFGYIQRMDICLNIFAPMPVSHKACPIKLFEYMSQGKPVISTRLDELRHIDDGFLYYADSGPQLVSAIRDVLENPGEAARKAQRGQAIARMEYTWEKIAQVFVDAIDRARKYS